MSNNPLLDSALWYARQGLPIIPIVPYGKRPIPKDWTHAGTTDEQQIIAWWSETPTANIGLLTGAPSGLDVVDVDIKHHEGKYGDESLEALKHDLGDLPDTWEVITWSGGRHIYFRMPDGGGIGNSVGKVADWIDTRSTGGQVLLPPSVIRDADGQDHVYQWEASSRPTETEIAALPEKWLEHIRERTSGKGSGSGDAFQLPDNIPATTRNSTIFKYASSLRARRIKPTEILRLMHKANAERCKPALDDSEIETIYNSVMRYEEGTSRSRSTYSDFADGDYTGGESWTTGEGETVHQGDGSGADPGDGQSEDQTGDQTDGSRADPRQPDDLMPRDFTDAGNSEVFQRLHINDLLWTKSGGWYAWTGRQWKQDDNRPLAMAKAFTDRMLEDARSRKATAALALTEATEKAAAAGAVDVLEKTAEKDAQEAAKSELSLSEAYEKHAKNTRSAGRIKAIVTLTQPFCTIEADKLDADPFVLNTPAGLYDLRSGAVRRTARGDLCTHMTKAIPSYNNAQQWVDFLEQVTCGDHDLMKYLQHVVGMALFGEVYEEGILIAYGNGRNGKSTLFNAVFAVLGDYAGSVGIDILCAKNYDTKRFRKVSLRGRRLIIGGELEEGARLSASTVKELASTDPYEVEHKHKDPETVRPTHTILLYSNHLPKVSSLDNGTWRRLKIIPFNAVFEASDDETVTNYAKILEEQCGGAILQWAIDGAREFYEGGRKLHAPAAVLEATQRYRDNENWLLNFLNDCCVLGPERRVQMKTLSQEYARWAIQCGERPRSQGEIGKALEAAGYTYIKPQNKKVWLGIEIQTVFSSDNNS